MNVDHVGRHRSAPTGFDRRHDCNAALHPDIDELWANITWRRGYIHDVLLAYTLALTTPSASSRAWTHSQLRRGAGLIIETSFLAWARRSRTPTNSSVILTFVLSPILAKTSLRATFSVITFTSRDGPGAASRTKRMTRSGASDGSVNISARIRRWFDALSQTSIEVRNARAYSFRSASSAGLIDCNRPSLHCQVACNNPSRMTTRSSPSSPYRSKTASSSKPQSFSVGELRCKYRTSRTTRRPASDCSDCTRSGVGRVSMSER